MKDMIAHLTGWNRSLVARLDAALHGKPEPPPPWPANLETDDAINEWIYESHHGREVHEVLDETQGVFQKLFTVIENLPDHVKIELIEPAFYLAWIGDQRFLVGEFFNHFHDDHESDIRAWLDREKKQ